MRGKPGASEQTREELLEAGLRVLLRDGLPPGFNVKVTDVVKEANRTTGAAYQIWQSQQDFRLDLAVHVARSVSYADPTVLAATLEAALASEDNILGVVNAVGRAYFEHLVARPEFYLSLHFWATADNLPETVRSAVQDSYREIQSSFEAFFGFVLDHFGVAVAEPYTLESLTTAATATTEGMALRYRFATTGEEREELTLLYVRMLSSLLQAMADVTADDR